MVVILLLLGIILSWKKPEILNRIVYYGLFLFVAILFVNLIVGGSEALNGGYSENHKQVSHILNIFLFAFIGISIPAGIGYCIRNRSILGFRKVPTGILVLLLLMVASFTGYLKPDNIVGHEAAQLRFEIFHYYVSVPLVFIATIRWWWLMKKTKDIKY